MLFKLLGPGDASTDLKTYVQNFDFASPTNTWCSVAYLLNILDSLKPSIFHIQWRSVGALLSFWKRRTVFILTPCVAWLDWKWVGSVDCELWVYHSILPFIVTLSANCILVFIHQISAVFPSNVVVCPPALLSNVLTWFAKNCTTSIWRLHDVVRINEILRCGSLLLHYLSAVVIHTFKHGVLDRGLVRSHWKVIILRPKRHNLAMISISLDWYIWRVIGAAPV